MNPYLAELEKYFKRPRVHANLNHEKVRAFAAEVALKDLPSPQWREPVFPEDDLDFVERLGIGSSINFHYTDCKIGEKFKTLWPECASCRQQLKLYEKIGERIYRCVHAKEVKMWSGAFGMWACLMRAKDDDIPISDPRFLRSRKEWTIALARFVFRGIEPTPVIPMPEERWELIRESGRRLEAYGDQWMNIFRMSSFRAFDHGLGAVERLVNEFPSFSDEYRGFPGSSGPPLPFFKRAHLFVQMYEGRARSSKVLPRIKDPELLILPADYELPRALRAIDALEYSPELLYKIVNKKEIKEGSVMEIEIRLDTVEAGEIFQNEINAIRKAHGLLPYSKVELDYLLWTQGLKCTEPHNLTPSTKY